MLMGAKYESTTGTLEFSTKIGKKFFTELPTPKRQASYKMKQRSWAAGSKDQH